MGFTRKLTMKAGLNGRAFVLIACDQTGYSDETTQGDILYNFDQTDPGTNLPAAKAVTQTQLSSCNLSPFAAPTVRDDRNAIVLSQKLAFIHNDQVATARKGRCLMGWIAHNGAPTLSALESYPGVQEYDVALLDASQTFEVYRPPYAMINNNRLASINADFSVGTSGFLFLIVGGAVAGDTFTVEIKTTMFYHGTLVSPTTPPIFSTAAMDCVQSCWIREFGATNSLYQQRKGASVQRIHKEMEKHNIANTPHSLLSSIWGGVKKVGKWALSELGQALPGLLPLLL